MKILTVILLMLLELLPSGKAYMKQLQQRDSILIADQLEYGFQLDSISEGTPLALQDFSKASNDTLTLVRNWQIDTLKVFRKSRKEKSRLYNLKASIVLAPFEEGHYVLPPLGVVKDGDTLVFEPLEIDVTTIQIDTATFEMHDIKGQMKVPLTREEVLPWVGLAVLLLALGYLLYRYLRARAARRGGAEEHRDPAYIVALRELDKFRSDKYWAPEKQKAFYSGITDTLKEYIGDRYGVDAPEMTTAELFDSLKNEKSITPELYNDTRDLFERADFVKFAKHTASEEENAAALPVAVRFVTSTYQTELEEEQKKEDVL